MIRKPFLFALFFVLMVASVSVFADKPPQALFQRVTDTSQVIFQGECDVKSLNKKDTLCLIFYDDKNDMAWVVLFDQDKDGAPQVTHVVMAKDGHEATAWCRQDICL